MKTITQEELEQDFEKWLDHCQQEPVLITRLDGKNVVLVGYEMYSRLTGERGEDFFDSVESEERESDMVNETLT